MSAPVPRLQVSGYRFLLRRMELALLGADPGSDHRGGRTPSLVAGCVVAAVVVAAGAILGSVRPQALPDDAPIVVGSESGVVYVRIGEALHPVLNTASARLIAATDAAPRRVRDSEIDGRKRGPLMGIPGAPQRLTRPVPDDESIWTVCDIGSPPTTVVIVGKLAPDGGSATLAPEHTMVVSADSGTLYSLHRGRRAVVHLPATARRARGLSAGAPRPVSALLLNAIPEAPGRPETTPGPAVDDAAVLCVRWAQPDKITVLAGAVLPLPADRQPVRLAQADEGGPALDAVYLPPGRSAYVQVTGVRYLVTDTGVRFVIPDDDTAQRLGLPVAASPAPWPVLAGLPQGPELNRQNALTAWDVVPAPRTSAAGQHSGQ